MKVLMMHLLEGARQNPYVGLLAEALVGENIAVVGPRKGRLYLWKSIKAAKRPDVVHLQWQHGYFTGETFGVALRRSVHFFFQFFVIRLAGIPVVWTIHNLINHEGRQGRWELLMCRVLARSVSAMIVHCDSVVARVAHVYRIDRRRIRVIPHGNYLGVYPDAQERALARRDLGLDSAHRVLLFLGQVRAYKGVAQLIDAFRSLEDPRLRLILAGEPKFQQWDNMLERIRSDSRIITEFNFIEDERLVAYLSACDLVVLPYHRSLTSGAAMLAASYGRPLVAPRLGCMQEFPEEAAVLFDAESSDGLEVALRQALAAPLDEMGFAARAYVERFSWSSVGRQTAEVYADVCVRT